MTYIGNTNRSTGQRLLNQFQQNNERVSKSLERLSTGKRINRPEDDPAGFVAAEKLRGDLIDLRSESRTESGNRLESRQRESALSHIQTVLTSVRGLLVTAADGTLTAEQRTSLQQEIDASLDAIDLIATNTTGVAGSTALAELREGGSANVIDGDVAAAALLVDGKLSALSSQRAAIGAYERTHFEVFEKLREDQIAITTEALSQIEDTDFAAEAAELVQGRILSEASMIALAYSNRELTEQMEEILEGLDESTEQ